jgi:hypothetical protein
LIQSYFTKTFDGIKDQKEVYQNLEETFISWVNK